MNEELRVQAKGNKKWRRTAGLKPSPGIMVVLSRKSDQDPGHKPILESWIIRQQLRILG